MNAVSLLLATLSGAGTLLGGGILVICKPNIALFPHCQAASAGCMLYLSLSLFMEATLKVSTLVALISCAIGAFISFIIHKFIPDELVTQLLVETSSTSLTQNQLLKSTIITFCAMALHKFSNPQSNPSIPEGISVAFASAANLKFGINLCIAILLHNILEGLVVALPLYAVSNRSIKTVLFWTGVNGMMEPLGVLIAWFFQYLFNWDPTLNNGISKILAGVAGIMVGISILELIPSSREKLDLKTLVLWVVFGITLASFILFASDLIQSQFNKE